MKIKLVQYSIGGTDAHKQICDLAKEINSKYCQLHNYDYHFYDIERQEVSKVINTQGDDRLDALTYRTIFLYNQLMKQDCDYLVYLDTDAIVNKPIIKIEDLIDEQHELFISRFDCRNELAKALSYLYNNLTFLYHHQQILLKEYPDVILQKLDIFRVFESFYYGHLVWNEGFLIIKNSEMMRQFYEKAINLTSELIDLQPSFLPTDSKVFGLLTLKEKYNKKYTYLNDFSQGGYNSQFEARYNEQKSFILHDYLINDRIERIEHIKQLKKNKWWKEYFNED